MAHNTPFPSLLILLTTILCLENAVILILCRNSDLDGIKQSLKSFEETFNRTYKYPYLFLNDVDFTEEFQTQISVLITAPATFATLKREEWEVPAWIDQAKMAENMKSLEQSGVIYGGSLSYRKMCRFFSGFFYKNEHIQKYDYYWRIEPGITFFCKMNYDPFKFMKDANKMYGFVIAIREFMQTIPSLWDVTLDFLRRNRALVKKNGLNFIFDGDQNGFNYNGCHFWSNFEIGNLNFFRSEPYERYFEFLDRNGGFFLERWGDAPVHSLAASIFLGRDGVHFFDDIGYEHPPFMHCPSSPSRLVECNCKPESSIDKSPFSCLRAYINEVFV